MLEVSDSVDWLADHVTGSGVWPLVILLLFAAALLGFVLRRHARSYAGGVSVTSADKPAAVKPTMPKSPSCTAPGQGGCGSCSCGANSDAPVRRVRIVYASQKGTARAFAHRVFTSITRWRAQSPAHASYVDPPQLTNAASYDAEQLSSEDLVIFVVSTYTEGNAPDACRQFQIDLKEIATDFRYGAGHLARQTAFVFGLGDIAYTHNFNRFAKDTHEWLRSLGAQCVSQRFASEKRAQPLIVRFIGDIAEHLDTAFKKRAPQPSLVQSMAAPEDADSKAAAVGPRFESETDEGEGSGDDGPVGDVEDIGGVGMGSGDGRSQLLYPRLRESLTKQGYSLVGSHSGVKLCRWTKAMLRGRGGCYKHTFYNISSFQCMEMTPSLACANKCVFCWRHHTNPVGKEFTWQVDTPEFLVENAIAAHQGMLRPLRGVPGVTVDRLAEAMNVKHCALSLVGEPIMYPRINEFLNLVHAKHISTFMVTNAQFPDRIRDLMPVTQLYLSIDAATKGELQRIDRPLFEDFWERMIASIHALRAKRQRTVFRLTLVDGYNMTDVRAYCDLIELGCPDFIEIKGVTYCGNSDASPITMQNVPFHVQVVDFCRAVVTELASRNAARRATSAGTSSSGSVGVRRRQTPSVASPEAPDTAEDAGAATGPLASSSDTAARSGFSVDEEYGIACEHEHSCCVLIAHRRFHIDGAWNTWIDYSKFFALLESGRTDFDSLEYSAPTPGWAVFQSPERGFDPTQTRHYRRKRVVPGGGC